MHLVIILVPLLISTIHGQRCVRLSDKVHVSMIEAPQLLIEADLRSHCQSASGPVTAVVLHVVRKTNE